MEDKEWIESLNDVRTKLEKASLQLYEIRLGADAEPYQRAMMDTARKDIDECIHMLTALTQ